MRGDRRAASSRTCGNGGRSPGFGAFVDLLGAVVAEVFVDDAVTFRIFGDGRQFRVFDVFEQYESFQIDEVIV